MARDIDYKAAFECLPGAAAMLSTDFTILAVSDGYIEAAGREADELVGRSILEAFPENPQDPADTGPSDLRASLEAVVASRERDVMGIVRYDVEDLASPGEFQERYWAIINTPVCTEDGELEMIGHCAFEVTQIIRQSQAVNS